jgi:RNA polymerase sigma-70 factor (ECF subfamily)
MNLASIIREAKEGNEIACQHLISTTKEAMLVVCLRYIQDPRDAEERMLDGFYKCLASLPDFTYESDAMFYVWLKQIMIRKCLTYLKKKTFLVVPENDLDELALEPDAVDKLSAGEIIKMIDQLPDGYRTVFSLHVLNGLEHKEIAGLLGIKESTSRSQLTKARVCLQKILILNGYNHVGSKSME